MTTATLARSLVATLVLSGAAALAASQAQAQDFGLMVRIAQAQPGAAVVLAQLKMRQVAAPAASLGASPAARPPVAVAVARPALAVTVAAAAVPRPLPLIVAAAR